MPKHKALKIMNNLINSTTQKMSSREIAQLTGKQHKNVLVDCDKLNESYREMGMAEISAADYNAENGQAYREFLLTKIQCFDLMTGYNTHLRIKVNRRWEELETEKRNGGFQIPKSYAEALELAATQAKKVEQQQQQIEEMKPKQIFADAVSSSNTSILVGELAKLICQNGFEIGGTRLFKWLRNKGYLGKLGKNYNVPGQRYVEQGLFEIKETSVVHSDGHTSINITPKVTGKGQVYFINKFLNS